LNSEPTAVESHAKMMLHGELPGEASILSDLLLFVCMAAFATGIVLAAASLLAY